MTPAASAVVLIAIIAITAVTAAYVIITAPREDPAAPAGVTGPGATLWLRALHHEPEWQPGAPPPAVMQPLELPSAAENTLGLLARVRDKLRDLPPLQMDATIPLPAALCELGMPTEAYVDALFAKYAEVAG